MLNLEIVFQESIFQLQTQPRVPMRMCPILENIQSEILKIFAGYMHFFPQRDVPLSHHMKASVIYKKNSTFLKNDHK